MDPAVTHFEIPVDDMARAQAFYRDAFGWRVGEVPGTDHTQVQSAAEDGRGINGTLLPRFDPVLHPVITVTVADIDAALATIEELGGVTVQGRTPAGEGVFAAYARDSESNLIGLRQLPMR
jgi:predicted enzyme related to lactoylglutathione lyase